MVRDGSKDVIAESALPTVYCPRGIVQKRSEVFSAALKRRGKLINRDKNLNSGEIFGVSLIVRLLRNTYVV